MVLVFAVLCVLWIASVSNVIRTLYLGLTLAIAYAITEVLFSASLYTFNLLELQQLTWHFIKSFLSAIHLPGFLTVGSWIHHRFHIRRRDPLFVECWFGLGIPALFVLAESIIPRPIGWKLGHSLFKYSWILQGSEFAGTQYLSFAFLGMGALLSLLMMPSRLRFPDSHPVLAVISIAYWLVPVWGMRAAESEIVAFQSYKNRATPRMLQMGIVYANLPATPDSKDFPAELEARCNSANPNLSKLFQLTDTLDKDSIHRDLILWPTLVNTPYTDFESCRPSFQALAQKLKTTLLVSRARATEPEALHLVEPTRTIAIARIPVRTNFGRLTQTAGLSNESFSDLPGGVEGNGFELSNSRAFLLKSGERLGVSFGDETQSDLIARAVVDDGVYALFSFGGTESIGLRSVHWSKAFDTLRAVEYRIPIVRIGQSGVLFIVDAIGSVVADVNGAEPLVLKRTVTLPLAPPRTLYASSNDWFVLLCLAILSVFAILILRRKSQPIPLYLREAQKHQIATEALKQTLRSQPDDSK